MAHPSCAAHTSSSLASYQGSTSRYATATSIMHRCCQPPAVNRCDHPPGGGAGWPGGGPGGAPGGGGGSGPARGPPDSWCSSSFMVSALPGTGGCCCCSCASGPPAAGGPALTDPPAAAALNWSNVSLRPNTDGSAPADGVPGSRCCCCICGGGGGCWLLLSALGTSKKRDLLGWLPADAMLSC